MEKTPKNLPRGDRGNSELKKTKNSRLWVNSFQITWTAPSAQQEGIVRKTANFTTKQKQLSETTLRTKLDSVSHVVFSTDRPREAAGCSRREEVLPEQQTELHAPRVSRTVPTPLTDNNYQSSLVV